MEFYLTYTIQVVHLKNVSIYNILPYFLIMSTLVLAKSTPFDKYVVTSLLQPIDYIRGPVI